MLKELPVYIALIFGLTTLITLIFIFIASNNSRICLILALGWLGLQAALALTHFFTITDSIPPRPVLFIGPPLLAIILLFSTGWGKRFIDGFNTTTLTWLHTVRVPVEIGLFLLAAEKSIPEVLTFEGRNFDIIAGITAPLIAFYGMKKKLLSKPVLIGWNVLCLGLLLNVVTHGVLSLPSVIQQIEFDQPNMGMLYFPFNWLPAFIVPVVMFSHLVSLRKIIRGTY